MKTTLGNIKPENKLRFLRDYIWKISPSDGHVTVEKMLVFLNKRVETAVEFKEDMNKVLYIFGGIVLIGILVWGLFACFPRVMLNTKLWFFCSMVFLIFFDFIKKFC